MALKNIVDSNGRKITESYSADGLYGFISTKARKVLTEHNDFVEAIGSKLEDYCTFSGGRLSNGRRGGAIMDGYWSAKIKTDNEKTIEIQVTQGYTEHRTVKRAKVTLKYDSEVLKKDLIVAQRAITSSGLKKIKA